MTGDPVPRFPGQGSAFVLVVSGPSGVGKTAVCERLLAGDPHLLPSVSATTRPPRPGEQDGRDYHFWPEQRFRDEVARGRFLEWAEVHGHFYGTPHDLVEKAIAGGMCPLLNIDVQGGSAVKRQIPDAVLVFLFPPSLEALTERLRRRGTESEDAARGRLTMATREMARWTEYDYAVVNDDLPQTVARVAAIVEAERFRASRLAGGRP